MIEWILDRVVVYTDHSIRKLISKISGSSIFQLIEAAVLDTSLPARTRFAVCILIISHLRAPDSTPALAQRIRSYVRYNKH